MHDDALWRSWAVPRSRYLLAVSSARLGETDAARSWLAKLLEAWSGADPDLPLLAEARALGRILPPGDARLGVVPASLRRDAWR
jgi:hypothetical protein